MKTYYLTLSQVFPATHARAGQPTGFRENLFKTKLHTIRANYEFWKNRFEQIEKGEACLSIRQWTGKPYRSKQVEIARLTREDQGFYTSRGRFVGRQEAFMIAYHANQIPISLYDERGNNGRLFSEDLY